MAYDRIHKNIVLFGGSTVAALFGYTWIWDGTNWIEQHPLHNPPNQTDVGMTYDENRQRVILLGNNYLDGSISTWSWDGQDWTRLETYQYPPYTMTVGGKLVYLPDLQTVVLINNYRQKVCSVDGCTFFPEEMQIWALTYRYLTFIPIISK